MARTQSRAKCAFCDQETAKGAMTRHLQICPEREKAVDAANANKDEVETLLYLRVQDAYNKDFWLDLEMRGDATLKKLDDYLRAIWLECCGHLSKFSVGGWGTRDIGKNQPALKAFNQWPEILHIYDFGTSSETKITLIGFRQGKPLSKHPIFLMARNLAPVVKCQECGQPATQLCMECVYEHEKEGFLCPEHAENHPHDDYGDLIPLVNSPRVGLCGYDGPADPPY